MRVFDWITTMLLVIAVGYVAYTNGLRPQSNPESPSTGVGKRLPLIDRQNFENIETLILSVRSTCRFCTDSMPFYRQLLERRRQSGSPVQVVVVSSEQEERTRSYLAEHGIHVDRIAQVDVATWRDYLRTPTLLHVNGSGVIENQWIGQLTPEGEQRVLAALRFEPKSRRPLS